MIRAEPSCASKRFNRGSSGWEPLGGAVINTQLARPLSRVKDFRSSKSAMTGTAPAFRQRVAFSVLRQTAKTRKRFNNQESARQATSPDPTINNLSACIDNVFID
jgi:hypothetical protein